MDKKIRKAAQKIVEGWIALPGDREYDTAIKFVIKEIKKATKR